MTGGQYAGDVRGGLALAGTRDPVREGVRVAVLGPLTITGTAQDLQPKQAELVVALALGSPGGTPGESLRGHLGTDPDHPRPSDSLRQVITRTRRRLGRTPGGGEYIIHCGNAVYILDPAASLDWDEFRLLASCGRENGDRAALRAAVRLLRGQPLTGLYYWWLDPVLVETMRAEVVDVTAELAELELSAADPAAARRAARAGLCTDRTAEQLWRLLMLAEDASGNTAGVYGAWRGCLDAIADIAPGGQPHDDTAAVYRRLTGSRSERLGHLHRSLGPPAVRILG